MTKEDYTLSDSDEEEQIDQVSSDSHQEELDDDDTKPTLYSDTEQTVEEQIKGQNDTRRHISEMMQTANREIDEQEEKERISRAGARLREMARIDEMQRSAQENCQK